MSEALVEASAGAIGSAFANTIVFPLDVVKARLQVQNKAIKDQVQYKSALDAMSQIVKREGFVGLYSGLASGLTGNLLSSFSYFYIYSTIRKYYISNAAGNEHLGVALELALGAFAGALSQLVVLPIGVVNTRQQTDAVSGKLSIIKVLRKIILTDGLQGLWKGLGASLVLCSNPAITYGLFERCKSWVLSTRNQTSLTTLQIFVIGAISKAVATIVTYPYIMAKVRMQWEPPQNAKDIEIVRYKSALDVLKKIYTQEGLQGWYKGLDMQIAKAVVCQIILFVTKEKLTTFTLGLFEAFPGIPVAK